MHFRFLIFLLGFILTGPAFAQQTRGALVLTPTDTRQPVTLYSKSYALVIGIDAYSGGWPRLSNAVNDAKAVAAELKQRAFDVTTVINPNAAELRTRLEDFIFEKGRDKTGRLFVWFAGHGHTINGEGYLVPADAPAQSDWKFRRQAYSLRSFGRLMREARSKHVLAVFDSCFAGTVFNTVRSLPPKAVTRATTLPVRQFVSSGEANQEVSDDGTFRKLFIDALRGDEPRADANGDGYVTGTEIGLFLSDKVTNLSQGRQTPRYGKIRALGYDRGDFVFRRASSATQVTPPAVTTVARSTDNANKPGYWPLFQACVRDKAHFRKDRIIKTLQRRLSRRPHQFGWVPEGRDRPNARIKDKDLEWKDITGVRVAEDILELDFDWRNGKLRLVPVLSKRWGTRSVRQVAVGLQGLWATDNSYGCVELRLDDFGEARGAWGVHQSKRLDSTVFVRRTPASLRRRGSRNRKPNKIAKADPRPTVQPRRDACDGIWINAGAGGRQCVKPGSGRSFKDCDVCPEMVVAPAGSFMMGSNDGESDEKPIRKVIIGAPLAVGKYEATFAEWDACVAGGGCKHKPEDKGWGRGKRPAINVTWNAITNQYLPWLSRKTGKTYRLPSEAEWEYVARAGTTSAYWWGDKARRDHANYGKEVCCGGLANGADKWLKTAPVGSFKANAFGLHDLHGNVWEWVQDCYKGSYRGAPTDASAVTNGKCEDRVLRGGSWFNYPRKLRSANRNRNNPDYRFNNFGFRIVRMLTP